MLPCAVVLYNTAQSKLKQNTSSSPPSPDNCPPGVACRAYNPVTKKRRSEMKTQTPTGRHEEINIFDHNDQECEMKESSFTQTRKQRKKEKCIPRVHAQLFHFYCDLNALCTQRLIAMLLYTLNKKIILFLYYIHFSTLT